MPDAAGLRDLCEVLGVRSDWLLFGDGPKLRDQARDNTELAADVAAFIVREVAIAIHERERIRSVARGVDDSTDLPQPWATITAADIRVDADALLRSAVQDATEQILHSHGEQAASDALERVWDQHSGAMRGLVDALSQFVTLSQALALELAVFHTETDSRRIRLYTAAPPAGAVSLKQEALARVTDAFADPAVSSAYAAIARITKEAGERTAPAKRQFRKR